MAKGMHAKQGPMNPQDEYRRFRKILKSRLKKEILDPGVKARKRLVAKWSPHNRPKWRGKIKETATGITSIDIVITNSEQKLNYPGTYATIGMLWTWWEYTGTKPHPIYPRPSPPGPGVLAWRAPTGELVVVAYVKRHPGTKPKHATKRMNAGLEFKIGSIYRSTMGAF